jgi:hypothetical protein
MQTKTAGELKVGDIVNIDVPAKVKIISIESSEKASGMKKYTFEIVTTIDKAQMDIGKLVPVRVEDD